MKTLKIIAVFILLFLAIYLIGVSLFPGKGGSDQGEYFDSVQ